MLLPTFISAFTILATYALAVELWVPEARVELYPPAAINRILAETYIGGASRAPIVIVGSSLARQLPAAVLRPAVANLALPGDGPLTGVELVNRAGAMPRLVLVETNFAERGVDQKFLNDLFEYPWSAIRRHLKAAQHAYRPVNLLLRSRRDERPSDAGPPPEMLEKLVAANLIDLSRGTPAAILSERLQQLEAAVARLTARGICVAFFEMPVDERLADTETLAANRKEMVTRFPPERFTWLSARIPGKPRTSDGLHLLYTQAAVAATELMKQAEDLAGTPDCRGS